MSDLNVNESTNVDDILEMDPESEVLVPVQKRIEEQLRKHLQEITQQLQEANTEFTVVQKERETCGVNLYNAQQHLSKIQETLEVYSKKHASIQVEHEEKLRERGELSSKTEAAQKKTDDLKKQCRKIEDDLTKLTETVLKVERFNEQLKSEVELERRAAHKTEDDITKLERAKLRQDELVASLHERIHGFEEQSALLDEQIEAQRAETRTARDTLAEAMGEIEAINVEKRQLVHQWKSSLIGMQRRHDAMKKTDEALHKQKDDLQAIENEIEGFRKDIQGVQVENGKLEEFMSRVSNEIIVLKRQRDTLCEKRDKSVEDCALMQKSVEKAEGEIKILEQQLKVRSTELTDLNKLIEKHAAAILAMENDVLSHLRTQTTLKTESQSVLSEIEKIKNAISAKELQVTNMENELSRIRVDYLQAKAYNETLQGTLVEIEGELNSRGAVNEQLQQEIRRRNDEIDRKQKRVDQLNRLYEQIMSAQGGEKGEHLGPLEATINSLSKAITTKSAENEALQQEWIKLQTELVGCKNAMNETNEAIHDFQTKSAILAQKRDRLASMILTKKKEIAELNGKSNDIHLEMKRINTLVSKNSNVAHTTANDVFILENDLIRRLEDKRRQALQLEKRVDETRQTKADTLQQIMDCDRDIMFWERKLQIARETEMALDPAIGRAEIEKMKKEIAYMEQRMAQLQREQKFLIEEMQRLIDHREVIRMKGKAVLSATHAQKRGTTRLTVEKENARLFKELNKKRQEAQAKERQVKENLAEMERTASLVDNAQREVEELEEQIEALQSQLTSIQKEQGAIDAEKRLKENSLRRLRDAEKGSYKLTCYPEDAEAEATRLENNRRRVLDIMEELANQFPDLATDLQNLMPSV